MIGKLNHIAIAVPNLVEASSVYNDILGAKVSEPIAMPEALNGQTLGKNTSASIRLNYFLK